MGLIGRVVVPTGRIVVPTGRVVVPTGKVIIIVSPGRLSLVPTGRICPAYPFLRRDLKHNSVPNLELHRLSFRISEDLLSILSILHPLLDQTIFSVVSWINSGPVS
ncbi:hypothetical protein Tco_1209228 [Tanacetum coccineum]